MEANIHEAKTHFSKLLAKVAAGEEVIITRAGEPVARLVPFVRTEGLRPLGMDAGRGRIAADFDAPISSELLPGFEP